MLGYIFPLKRLTEIDTLLLRGYHGDDDDTIAQMSELGRCGGMVVMSGYVAVGGGNGELGRCSEGGGTSGEGAFGGKCSLPIRYSRDTFRSCRTQDCLF